MDEVQKEYKKRKNKFLRGHECLCCVLLQVEATGRSLVQGRPTECVSLCLIKRNNNPVHLE
jgi:hypothetical protein